MERVRESGGEPIIFHTSYYPICLFPGLANHNLETGSMYQTLNVQITTYTAGRRPIQLVKALYRGDRCQFTVTPQRVEV